MLMLPVPAFVALILIYLALRAAILGQRWVLATFLAACALQSLGVALVQGYDVRVVHLVLPISASVLPPLAWISFRAALFRPIGPQALLHLTAPLFCLFCRLFAPATLDAVVALIFFGYGLAIVLNLRPAQDLPLARIGGAGVAGLIWRAVGWLLIASACCDVLIALAYAAGKPFWADRVISGFASVMVLFLGVLSSLQEAAGAAEARAPDLPPDDEVRAQDAEIVLRLDGLLVQERLFLDADLSILRLARRLHLPEKRLSAAVNRATGGNVSRYINAWRIRHACGLLRAGQTVTEAMLGSGFNTKSNFNREFLRVTQVSPSVWLSRAGPRWIRPASDRPARRGWWR